MSISNRVNEHLPRPVAGLAGGSVSQKTFLVLGCGLLIGTGLSFFLSSPAAESDPLPHAGMANQLPVDGAASAAVATSPPSAQPPVGASRYRVVAETAYFFDAPRQAAPNGKYLRRGDVFYGEAAANGFVKTQFVSPDGSTVVGWLKGSSLSKLAETPVAGVGSRQPSAPLRPPAAPQGLPSRAPRSTASVRGEQASPDGAAATKAVVQTRSYFYPSPDLAQPRKAYCEPGDKVLLGETRGAAVYVSFTNWEKVTTTGWMRKDALRNVR